METKEKLKKLRGWFPQEPKVGIIQSTNLNMQANKWVSLPFFASGILMIIAAVVSAYFGFNLLLGYQATINKYNVIPDYASLYMGLLSVLAVASDIFAALWLLIKKQTTAPEIAACIVLAYGLASPWIFMYFHSPLIYMYYDAALLNGLVVGSPMIVFSLATLIIVRLNRKKLKPDTNDQYRRMLPFMVSGALMSLASLSLAYNAADLLWVIWFSGSALGNYFTAYLEVLLYLSLIGLDLFIASLLLKRKRVGVAAAIVGVMLVVGLPLQLILLRGNEMPFYVFDSPTVAFLFATLILVGLNFGSLKQARGTGKFPIVDSTISTSGGA